MNIEDEAQLLSYLRRQRLIDQFETPSVKILVGGVSNKTVLVNRRQSPNLVIKQALEKLRVTADWFSDPARIHREAEGIRILQQVAPAGMIPGFVFEDEAHHVLGMEAIPMPHSNWKQDLLHGDIDTNVVSQFATCLGQIHRCFDVTTYPEGGILEGLDFFESLRLEPYYLFTARQIPAAKQFLDQLVIDTRGIRHALVHGDYSPKNVLVRKGRMILLDHEVIHLGDPAFDVGFSMTHLLSKAHHMKDHRPAFIDAANAYWQTYFKEIQPVPWLDQFEVRAVRHTLGCLLARVAGRSPLEYLSDEEKAHQSQTVQDLMIAPPMTMKALIKAFNTRLS